jgi:hypothetical protein
MDVFDGINGVLGVTAYVLGTMAEKEEEKKRQEEEERRREADKFLSWSAEAKKMSEQDYRETISQILLDGFPVGSKGNGIIDEKVEFSDLPLDFPSSQLLLWHRYYEPRDERFDIPSNAFKVNLINKNSGFFEVMAAQLKLPEIVMPSLDIAPYRASQLIPVRDLISRYFPSNAYSYPNAGSFIGEILKGFHGQKLSFEVVGAVNGVCLSVACEEIDQAIWQRWQTFNEEFEAIKAKVAKGIGQEDIDFSPWPSNRDALYPDTNALAVYPDSNALEGQPVLIDGSNVVRHDARHGWRVLKTLLDCLRRDGTDYFLYFDASITHLDMDDEGKAFIKSLLDDSAHTAKCPSRDEADKFILHRADKTGSHVISNDGYTQWEEQYPWVGVRNNTGDCRRVHKFSVEGDFLNVPDLGVYEPIGL